MQILDIPLLASKRKDWIKDINMENKVTLYDIKKDDGDWFKLRAFMLSDGRLVLEGQDFSKIAKEWFSDEEHEYFYIFDFENTNKLKVVLNTDDLLVSLVSFFNGEMINKEFFKFCEDNDIKFDTLVIQLKPIHMYNFLMQHI